jgi:hypothetical protein
MTCLRALFLTATLAPTAAFAAPVQIDDCAADPFSSGATCADACTWDGVNQQLVCNLRDVCPTASDGVEAKLVSTGGHHWFHGQCRGDDVTEVCCRITDATGAAPPIDELMLRGTNQADDLGFSWSTLDLAPSTPSSNLTAVLLGEAGDDDLRGSRTATLRFREFLYGDAGRDLLRGLAGFDDLTGGLDGDYVDGGDDADDLEGNEGHDLVAGGRGDDEINTHDGDDRVCDGQVVGIPTRHPTGNFFVFAGCASGGAAGHDVISTADGNDRVWAFAGDDHIDLGEGDDWADDATGGASLFGGEGADVLCAGASANVASTLDGDDGADLLVFYGLAPAWELNGGAGYGPAEADLCFPAAATSSLSFVYSCDATTIRTCPAPAN